MGFPKSGFKAAELRLLFLNPASRQALLGLRALAARPGTGRYRLASEAAKPSGLPVNALGKIFQKLARRGLLLSQRGPGGGYALARPASELTLADILRAVQDVVPHGHHCLLRNRLCLNGRFCLIHELITKADRILLDGFEGLTLQDLADSGGWG